MMDTILINFVLPVLTALIAWFGNAYRNKQKKEKDILDNVQQIMQLQKAYIAEQQSQLQEIKLTNKKMEAKLDRKNKSIRQANRCKFTNDGDGCPVLTSEETFDCCPEDCHIKINVHDRVETND